MILFDGCSWTKGEELEHPQEERYSKLICDELGAEETNLAANGGSNDSRKQWKCPLAKIWAKIK